MKIKIRKRIKSEITLGNLNIADDGRGSHTNPKRQREFRRAGRGRGTPLAGASGWCGDRTLTRSDSEGSGELVVAVGTPLARASGRCKRR